MRDTPQAIVTAVVFTTVLMAPAIAIADPAMERAIIVGAIADPTNTDTTADASDAAIPPLPVVTDDDSNSRANSQTGARGAHS